MNVTAADVIAAVHDSKPGPEVAAFFDLDGTLVHGYTAGHIYLDQLRRGEVGPLDVARVTAATVDGILLGGDPQIAVRAGLATLRGRRTEEVEEVGERLFVERIAGTLRPEARDLVRAHQHRGHTVAIASSATRLQAAPVAQDLGIRHVVCTELEEKDGVLTGRSPTGVLWGEAKAAAVRSFARTNGIDLRRSFGYADGPEDLAFLTAVGCPYPLNPRPELRRAAEDRGWPVLTLREPRSPGLRSYLGTLGALLGANTGVTTGMALGWLTGDHRLGINAGTGLAADLGLAFAGVHLRVVGEHNLEAARPAVFIANHQSTLDALVLGALLRHDFTAVAKKEARRDPRMIVIGAALDPVWIDRSDLTRAKASLDEVVQRLRDGVSILILPEGTRMPTPRLGRFKKGAFHIARQAGVPIVPIVLRNTGELAWRRSLVVNPGTVDVAVLDPVPTAGWTPDEIDGRIAEVRRQFVDTLEEWPTPVVAR